ncbi:MAG: DUF4012 domain-containing protein [Candidatus Magasanikbacteria bacterium]|nr:DUF4012 domain-containing protein [Candidatus Magasanikbacteria bacterium]
MFRKFSYTLIILGSILLLTAGVFWYFRGSLEQAAVKTAANQISFGGAGEQLRLTDLLGFKEPRTYLVLLLNNTELRPGGGFIGAYAVIRFNHGNPEIITVMGTENLPPPAGKLPTPPAPLSTYLKTDAWHFRDSNWSPDFASSTIIGLELYKAEGGEGSDEISGVIGFTPTVIEDLIKLIGPVTVQGQTYTAENFTEKLEYEVEYGYAKRGISFKDRKAALGELAKVLIGRLKISALTHWSDYLKLSQKLLDEKQIMIFAKDPALQNIVRDRGWSGEMKQAPQDYLLWVDANLGSLKTDAALVRSLSYRLDAATDSYAATAVMRYEHQGKTDWRTTHYRDYARIFVPSGSRLIKITGATASGANKKGIVDEGEENGRHWFGAYISIAPGQTKELSFQYALAPMVTAAIKRGDYELLVQKELGTLATPVTLNLNFATTVVWANPGEAPAEHGDSRYSFKTDLNIDREFRVLLQH